MIRRGKKFTPDTGISVEALGSLGYRTRSYKRRPKGWKPAAVVVHQPGNGTLMRNYTNSGLTPYEAAVRIYTQNLTVGEHYVVGQEEGEITQICPEEFSAWHVGSKGAEAYKAPLHEWAKGRYLWWSRRWPELLTPYQLGLGRLWEGGSCNANTIGIVVAPKPGGFFRAWSPHAMQNLRSLVFDICMRNELPICPNTIISHSDAHPLARTVHKSKDIVGRPWDPGPVQWDINKLLEIKP